jgi:hypothetical protein
MGIFRRKSKWEQLTEPVAKAIPKMSGSVPRVALGALRGVGVAVGLSAASAAVTAARQRKSRE